MMRAYKRHGKERDKMVQITCDMEVEGEFLAAMQKERIKELPPSYDAMRLTADHPARGEETEMIEAAHGRQVCMQGRRSAGASGMRAMSGHFAKLATLAEKRLEMGHHMGAEGPEARNEARPMGKARTATQSGGRQEREKQPEIERNERTGQEGREAQPGAPDQKRQRITPPDESNGGSGGQRVEGKG